MAQVEDSESCMQGVSLGRVVPAVQIQIESGVSEVDVGATGESLVHFLIFFIVLHSVDFSLHVDLLEEHLIFSQSASFIGENVLDLAQVLIN